MAENAAEPLVVAEQVVKDYGEKIVTRVLHEVDLALAPGEFTALMGPSGSGKSTLLNLIGLLDRPTAGRLRLCGQETTTLDEGGITRLRGRALGFVFQFHHLVPALTALENVMLPRYADRGRPDPVMRRDAAELLRRVGVDEQAGRRPSEMSGGQQQRVAIARALVMNPPLVLADEPTGNLDTKSADQVFALLREIHHERGTAFLIVTHDPRIAARCHRVIELVDGRLHG
jgi:lipoprotein-releasing system ATP-binding protein